jgi:hypothetical protein
MAEKFARAKERRRESAKVRQTERAKRSPAAQIKRLDEMLGKSNGAKKERDRLTKQLETR